MDVLEALQAPDYSAIADHVYDATGLPLLDALANVNSRDVESARPDGLWHCAAVHHNTLTLDRREPLGLTSSADGAALRAAMVAQAERGTLTSRRGVRALTDPAFLVVRPDGGWRGLVKPDLIPLEVQGGGEATIELDHLDRLEQALHPLATDEALRARLPGAPTWLAPGEAGLWAEDDAPSLDRLWPTSRDTVLSFPVTELPDDEKSTFGELMGEGATSAASLVRWKGKTLIRTLYLGDLSHAEGPARIDILMLFHRRLWAESSAT